MKSAFLLLAALLLTSSSAVAGNWHTLQSNPQLLLEADEPQIEANEDNNQDKTRKKEKKLNVWGKITYSLPEQARPGDFFYSSSKSLFEINCTKRTHRLLRKIYYTADGQESKSVRYGEEVKYTAIVPDSTEERIFDFACAFKPAKADNKIPKRVQPKSAATEKQSTSNKAAQSGKTPQKPEAKSAPNGKASAPDKSATAKSKDSTAAKPAR
ncbi:MAG: hypothetical protein Q8N54_09645 [Sulfurimicrobium sp.]|jgi:hypothetical protein|nr:hypothetical protein [Sulfurimicrobium sp.]MDZ7654979.1 hypothetical protein [Sulfurimicrobium sp.]